MDVSNVRLDHRMGMTVPMNGPLIGGWTMFDTSFMFDHLTVMMVPNRVQLLQIGRSTIRWLLETI